MKMRDEHIAVVEGKLVGMSANTAGTERGNTLLRTCHVSFRSEVVTSLVACGYTFVAILHT